MKRKIFFYFDSKLKIAMHAALPSVVDILYTRALNTAKHRLTGRSGPLGYPRQLQNANPGAAP